jgi:hypothetical protein
MTWKFNLNGNNGMLVGMAIVVSAAAVTLYRVDRVEAEQETDHKRLDCIEDNQRVLDRNQREASADVALANAQLRKLLDLQGVERIKRPPVPPSELKDPDE